MIPQGIALQGLGQVLWRVLKGHNCPLPPLPPLLFAHLLALVLARVLLLFSCPSSWFCALLFCLNSACVLSILLSVDLSAALSM